MTYQLLSVEEIRKLILEKAADVGGLSWVLCFCLGVAIIFSK